MNIRIFVEKKPLYQTEAQALKKELCEVLKQTITDLRLINVYDIFNIEKDLLEKAKFEVFAEIVTDHLYETLDLKNEQYIASEFLPGQYDLRADSAMQCLTLLCGETQAIVKSSKIIILDGEIDLIKIKKYLINPIESREKNLNVLELPKDAAKEAIKEISNFKDIDLEVFHKEMNLAMTMDDLKEIQKYFVIENRNPTETEIKMFDAYWSDHCRHTTFETSLEVDIKDENIKKSYEKYLKMREAVNRSHKPITLMDMATINAKYELQNGNLQDLEISEENNACSTFINVDIDGKSKEYVLMFKNETHNHPTEVEPFGGASTCIGGAIRDPMSGRSYVYQAARITGAGNIIEPIEDTIEGKLPQHFISKTAAKGNSSYGNQIGLANTLTKEIFHPGFVAKRMELGAVIGCAPKENIIRKKPIPGDVILLLGGKTGRDGIGGATGSSKEHNINSLELSAAEVQKGNAPEERKLVRLYRRKEVSTLIKKSNDFGAGGVSVAIGELAEGLEIYLDKVPLKYNGLNETEIALSESQERMAVVVSKENVSKFIEYAKEDNCSATPIAVVTNTNRLVMKYHDKVVVDIKREFLNTNGVRQKALGNILKNNFKKINSNIKLTKENVLNFLSSLNVCSQKGLQEMFDSTIGANTVLVPLGGKYQLTENQVSVSKIPLNEGTTNTVSILSYGYDPYLMEESPYYGAMYSVIESMAKVVAVGGNHQKIRFTFQEFFEKLGKNPLKWGKPISALLGTIEVMEQFNLASVGGKDSMSGTFKDINVPPTLVSFAVNIADATDIISSDFKKAKNKLYLINHTPLSNDMPNVKLLKENFKFIEENIKNKKIVSSYAITQGGLVEALFKSSFGNKKGFEVKTELNVFEKNYGSILVEASEELNYDFAIHLGEVSDAVIKLNDINFDFDECLAFYERTLNAIYPIRALTNNNVDMSIVKTCNEKVKGLNNKEEVNVLIPVFPGTNCDYDVYKAFKEASGKPEIFIFKNNFEGDVISSIKQLYEKINNTDILALAGGFSAGDEPDGSGKFIAAVLNNDLIKEAVNNLIKRKGLILGICNGFQALVKAGLLPSVNEKISVLSPTLAKNDINRHVSHIIRTTVTSTKSPWLSSFSVGDVHLIPVSHGEGKFIVDKETAEKLFNDGQVAFQYCDYEGNPTMDSEHNINGSLYAIEGLLSEDGLILGKMGHSERKGENIHKNIYGNKNQDIFKNAVDYFLKG